MNCSAKLATANQTRNYMKIKAWLIRHLLRPQWVVSEHNELSLKVWGIVITYYKRANALIYDEATKSRPVHRREFGEFIYAPYGKQNKKDNHE